MLGYLIGFLFVGVVLTLFDLDKALVGAVNEIFKTDFSTDVYWLAVVVLGLLCGLVHEIRN